MAVLWCNPVGGEDGMKPKGPSALNDESGDMVHIAHDLFGDSRPV
jgi:hypothetical protein